jgi:nucleoside-diphosphate-sugar epimerase
MIKKSSKIDCIVTGVDGFSGKEIFKFLRNKKINVLGISRKKNNPKIIKQNLENSLSYVSKKIKKNQINWLIHVAAYHKMVDFKNKPEVKSQKNQKMILNIIKLCKEKNIKNLIFFSTIDISYSNIKNKKKFYNLSKLKSENYLKKIYNKGNLERLFILRLPAIIGRDCNKNFISDLVYKFKNNQVINVWNENTLYNNFIHIEDINKLIFKIIFNRPKIMKILNCLSSKPIKLKNFINYVKLKLKSNSNIILKKSKQNKNRNRKINQNNFYKFMTVKRSINLYMNNRLSDSD